MAETWTYIDSSTIEVTGDLTAKYSPNQLIKITQTTVKFFVITAISLVSGNTRLTVNGGGIYTLANAAIASPAMTTNMAAPGLPYGFPYLYVQKTLTDITGTLRGRRAEFTLAPASAPSSLYAFGDYVTIGNAIGDVSVYGGMYAGSYTTTLRAGATASALDGVVATSQSLGGYCAALKGMWATASNYGRNAGFTYAFEAAANNFAYGGIGAGDTDLITSVRARIQNYVNNTISGGASGPANATIAKLIAANIINEKSGSGNGNYDATIGTASQIECDLSNIGGIITNHYYIKLNAPFNSGTLTNHWGIYLADQTVAGTTINYAIYSAGGKVYFGGEVITPHAISAPCISVAPDGTIFCIGSDKSLYKWDAGWTSLGGTCRSVAAISATEAMVIGGDDAIWKWASPSTWAQMTTAIP